MTISSTAAPIARSRPRATARRRLPSLALLTAAICVAGSAWSSTPASAQGTMTRRAATPATARGIPADAAMQVDRIFAAWDTNTSAGCAVGVTKGGLTVLERAYGMADLEHAVPNTPATIFEGGSLSKQFTAAAVVLLALDGKLRLEDDVRTYVPELPDYGHTITLHHLMTHTSGLRDWGSVASISGWGREQRSHDHDDVLDILMRQAALNFVPGHEYSYSNSGYNLLAIIVGRVSGMSFADFSRTRIFEPLGLRNTQWRDDYRRLVPGRSSAYQRTSDGWEINRPIENVHGNGGILTTVGDLGIWNQALEDGRLGGPAFLEMMHRTGTLNDGSRITYAGGLVLDDFAGVPAITHTGSTAGYRAFTGRYPSADLSVSMLCNASNVSTGGNGGQVARVFLGELVQDPTPNVAWTASGSASPVESFAGLYADPVTGSTLPFRATSGGLALGGVRLVRTGPSEFARPTGDLRYRFESGGTGAMAAGAETSEPMTLHVDSWQYSDQKYHRVEADWKPDARALGAFVGTYASIDAETTFVVGAVDGELRLWRRPADEWPLSPIYLDTFQAGQFTIRFRRDDRGAVEGFSLSLGRVYDMRFERVPG